MAAGSSGSRGPWARRIGWLVLLWAAGVAAVAVVAVIFRMIMSLAGMTV